MEFANLVKYLPVLACVGVVGFTLVKGVEPIQRTAVDIKYLVFPKTRTILVESLGIKSGDVIIGVNGIEFDNPRKAFEVVFNSNENTLRSVTVLRNGRRILLKNN